MTLIAWLAVAAAFVASGLIVALLVHVTGP